MRFYSDNPVRDFSRWDAEQERKRERHCRGACTHCGEDIYDWEDYYDIDGTLLHDDCLIDWAAQYKK